MSSLIGAPGSVLQHYISFAKGYLVGACGSFIKARSSSGGCRAISIPLVAIATAPWSLDAHFSTWLLGSHVVLSAVVVPLSPEELVDFVGHGVIRVVREVRPRLVAVKIERETGRKSGQCMAMTFGDNCAPSYRNHGTT